MKGTVSKSTTHGVHRFHCLGLQIFLAITEQLVAFMRDDGVGTEQVLVDWLAEENVGVTAPVKSCPERGVYCWPPELSGHRLYFCIVLLQVLLQEGVSMACKVAFGTCALSRLISARQRIGWIGCGRHWLGIAWR